MNEPDLQNIKSNVSKNVFNVPVGIFRSLGKVLNNVGITGFVVLAIVIFVYSFASATQKSDIIDFWLLFKGGTPAFGIVTFILLAMLFTQQVHYKRVIKLKEERIIELAGKKNSAYAKKLGQDLASSNSKIKK